MAGLIGKPKTISNTENKLGALNIQQSSQGVPVPIVFGTTRISHNLLWYGDFTAHPHTTTQSGGKGGGGGGSSNTSFTYTVSGILGLCEGPVQNFPVIGQVWSGKTLTDATALGLEEFDGADDQTAWTYLNASHANEALNYRGQCYVAAANFDLKDSNSLPNLSFEVTGFGEQGGGDENPAFVLTGLLTEINFGAGWPEAQISDWTAFSTYCAEANIAISPAYTAQTAMAETLTKLAQIANTAPVWSEGELKMIPYADETVGAFVPDLTVQYDLTYDDFIASGEAPIKVTRKRQADAYNSVQIECLDRGNQYNSKVVEAKDQSSIDTYGLRPMPVISAHEICDPAVAKTVAQTILQRALYVRNTYEFTLGWRYSRLEPMDIVSLTDPLLALDQFPVRITAIEEDEGGLLSVTAEELNIGTSTPGAYAVQATLAGNAPTAAVSVDPGDANPPVIFQPPLATEPQIWLGSSGGANWGGAQVWVSTDNSSFSQAGTIGPARHGVLTANFPVGTDPDTLNTLSVDLTTSSGVIEAASESAADALSTLTYIGPSSTVELIAYSDATLTAPHEYDLDGYIRRAQSGSTAVAHAANAPFMRIDGAVLKYIIPTSLYGTTIYVKLLSFNKTGGGL